MSAPLQFTFDLLTPFLAAREWLETTVASHDDGVLCPCCGRLDRRYRRQINRAAIGDLFALHRLATEQFPDAFYHYSEFMKGSMRHGDFAKFKFLDLIRRATNEDDAKRTSGSYKMTGKGHAFCRGEVGIPPVLVIYHDELVETEGDPKRIGDFWPKFDYRSLMEGGEES